MNSFESGIIFSGIRVDLSVSLSLSIFNHLPVCGNGYDLVDGVKVPNCKSVYIDPITGDLVINLVNVKEGEQAEVEVLTAGNVFDDTIYYGGVQ